MTGDALLLVDLQTDFLPGGALPVAGSDGVLPVARRCVGAFAERALPVYASRDWHPPGHGSFRDQGGSWPVHCVAGTAGAEFAAGLQLPAQAEVISKATETTRDAYSAFDGTALAARVQGAGVTRLFVLGLATDFCVLHSVVDALALGLAVVVLGDGIAAVNLQPGDGERALARMQRLGARVVDSRQLPELLDAR